MGFLIKAWFFLMFWAIIIGGPLLLFSDGPEDDVLESTLYDVSIGNMVYNHRHTFDSAKETLDSFVLNKASSNQLDFINTSIEDLLDDNNNIDSYSVEKIRSGKRGDTIIAILALNIKMKNGIKHSFEFIAEDKSYFPPQFSQMLTPVSKDAIDFLMSMNKN